MENLELYHIFYIVAETGSITKASEKLFISQPAVTKQIKNLENNLGCELFIRTPRGMILNEIGKSIYSDIKQAMICIENAEEKINKQSNLKEGKIKIGISTSLAKNYLIKYIDLFHSNYPNIQIEINTDPTTVLLEKLKYGLIDFIIAKKPIQIDKDITYHLLGEIKEILVAGPIYYNLQNRKVSLSELENYPILLPKTPASTRAEFDAFCKENNLVLKSSMEIASSNLLVEFTKIGYGLGLVTENYVCDEIKKNVLFQIKLEKSIPVRTFGILKLKNIKQCFASENFIELLTKNVTIYGFF